MNTRRQELFSRLWTRERPSDYDDHKDAVSRSTCCLLLLALVLIPWIGLGVFLLNAINAREQHSLQSAAVTRASVAAALLDHQVSDLIRTIDWLQSAPAAGGDATAGISDPQGVQFQARNSALKVIAPGSTNGSVSEDLDVQAQSAAKSALATKTPQITRYVDDTGLGGGLNLWLPLFKDGKDPVLLQARIPASFLTDAIKDFKSRGPWSMAVTNLDGAVLADLNGRHEQNGALKKAAVGLADEFAPPGSYVTATSKMSPLGFQVRAATPLAPLEAANRRNWAAFLIVTCLLTGVTLAAERSMFRGGTAGSDQKPQLLIAIGDTLKSRRHSQKTNIRPSPGQLSPQVQSIGEERLRDALGAGGICAWEWWRPNNTILWENSCAKLLRLPADMPPPTVRALVRRTFPHERRRLLHAIRIALGNGRPLSIDVRLTCFDGEQRWIALRANPLNAEAGRVDGFVGIAYDVTDQKRGLSRTDALLREVSHRSKNMLALILAMARLTARDAVDVKSHLKEFTLRVAGLAASQDLIVAADWQSVDFTTLASAEIEAVARSDAPRIKISGPPLLVTPEAAQTLGMILTELALNAAEHGALSVATGKVHLSWAFPSASTIKISWRETGGPEYDSARPKGYGLSIVERFSTQGLKLASHVANDSERVTWTLEGPLAHIGMHSPSFPA